ncbi:hypothetical protein [uncultured Fibrobacter sp.]|uniref:hypothetical protein n=1 Tax=uncultured Fibrobacter sp. TaxID=261512 RepID=UPI0025FCC3A2|nr:hypothetical protein [uncultured Fibrobacter sp.]
MLVIPAQGRNNLRLGILCNGQFRAGRHRARHTQASAGCKKDKVDKYRKMLKEKLSEAMDYCPGSFLDQLHEYPITDMPRWRRKRILNLLANMSEDGVPAFVSFDLDEEG